MPARVERCLRFCVGFERAFAAEKLMPARVERRWGAESTSEPARAGNVQAVGGACSLWRGRRLRATENYIPLTQIVNELVMILTEIGHKGVRS